MKINPNAMLFIDTYDDDFPLGKPWAFVPRPFRHAPSVHSDEG